MPTHTKNCPACRLLREVTEFSLDKYQKDGLGRICKSCLNQRRRKQYCGTDAKTKSIQQRRREKYAADQEFRRKLSQQNKDYRHRPSVKAKLNQKRLERIAGNKDRHYAMLRARDKRLTESLSDTYIKQLLRVQGINAQNLPSEFIEITRLQLQIKRLARKLINEKHN